LLILSNDSLLHTFVIDTTLLALCHYMVQPSDDYLQGVGQTHFNMKPSKLGTKCKVQFGEQRVLHYATAT